MSSNTVHKVKKNKVHKVKKNTVHKVKKDIISDLPSNIIESILECIPIRDAARTSILSRKWRNYWVSVPLVFDLQFLHNPFKESKFVKIIDEILLHHNRPIIKFILCVPKFFTEGNRDVDRWIHFLSRNGVKELTLDNSNQNLSQPASLKLPSYLFSCQELTHLELCNYIFKPPLPFRGFPCLISLELYKIVFDTNILQTLVSNSVLLERLIVVSCSGVGQLIINAPKLKQLRLCGLLSISLECTSNLSEVTFIGCKVVSCCRDKMPSLSELNIWATSAQDTKALMFMGDCTLDELRIAKIQFIKNLTPDLDFIKYLLVSSPKLQSLHITCNIDEKLSLSVAKELLRFHRASPVVEIIF